jgi:hypothetical protein
VHYHSVLPHATFAGRLLSGARTLAVARSPKPRLLAWPPRQPRGSPPRSRRDSISLRRRASCAWRCSPTCPSACAWSPARRSSAPSYLRRAGSPSLRAPKSPYARRQRSLSFRKRSPTVSSSFRHHRSLLIRPSCNSH